MTNIDNRDLKRLMIMTANDLDRRSSTILDNMLKNISIKSYYAEKYEKFKVRVNEVEGMCFRLGETVNELTTDENIESMCMMLIHLDALISNLTYDLNKYDDEQRDQAGVDYLWEQAE